MVVRLSGTQPQGPKHLETLENKTVDGTQNTVRVNRGTTANRPIGPVIGDLYYNTELKDLEQYTEDGWMLVAKQVPRVPAIVSATLDGSNNASVSFTPSAYGQPASSYTVQSNPGSYTATASSSPISISGTNLEIGTAYTFRVRSTGSYGQSAYSAYTSSAVTPVILSSYESIQTITVGEGGTSLINFTSIPSTYKHLQIRAIGRQTNSGSSTSSISIRINSDAGSNYANHRVLGENSIVYAQGGGNLSYFDGLAQWPISGSPANVFGVAIIDILDYANINKYKTLRSLNGAEGNNSGQSDIALASGLWMSTSAITSIQLTGSAYSGGFAQYSSFALYGIKGE
jgi:hypothetical protein